MSFEDRVTPLVPKFRDFAYQLCDLAEEMLDHMQTTNSDNFGVMGICFLSKQNDHLRTIVALGDNRDTELIARSMLEGLILFLWTAKENTEERSMNWRKFAIVHNYRSLKTNPGIENSLKPGRREELQRSFEEYDLTPFYSERAQKAVQQGKKLPEDPFNLDWTGLSVKDLFHAVDPNRELYPLYMRFSEWHHWNVAGLSRALDIRGSEIRYKTPSALSSAQSLLVGFQSLYQICENVMLHFKLDYKERLEAIRTEYLKFHESKAVDWSQNAL